MNAKDIKDVFIDMMPHGLVRLFNRNFNPARNFQFGSTQAIWLDTNKPYELYQSIPQLQTVVDKKAKMFSNIEWKLFDKKTGEEIEDIELFVLLKNPNVLNSQNSFLEEFKKQEQIYGNQFMYRLKPSNLTKYPSALWNISARYMQPVLSGKVFQQTELDKIILRYDFLQGSANQPYETKDVMYTVLKDLDNPVIGTSPINGLSKVLSNIDAAYQTRNKALRDRGAFGIFSRDVNDKSGQISTTLTDSEIKKDIQDQYLKQYGIGEHQMPFFITDTALKWQAMSLPTKDMMLFEEVNDNTLVIIDAFGMNKYIFSSTNGTYENVKQGLISAYQDTLQPEADKLAQDLSKLLQLPDNYNLVASYDHIQILKQNTTYSGIKDLIASLDQAVAAKILEPQQATIILQNELGKYLNTEGVFNSNKV